MDFFKTYWPYFAVAATLSVLVYLFSLSPPTIQSPPPEEVRTAPAPRR